MTEPMPPSAEPEPIESDGRILFCPFCRECYEGERVCPVHELDLVEFQDLPRQAHETDLPAWDEPVLPWDIRFGRGALALGALLLLVAFFLNLLISLNHHIQLSLGAPDNRRRLDSIVNSLAVDRDHPIAGLCAHALGEAIVICEAGYPHHTLTVLGLELHADPGALADLVQAERLFRGHCACRVGYRRRRYATNTRERC